MKLINTEHCAKAMEYTFPSSADGMLSRINHILGYKLSLRKFKKIKIRSSIFSDHNTRRLEINYRGKKLYVKKRHAHMEAKQCY